MEGNFCCEKETQNIEFTKCNKSCLTVVLKANDVNKNRTECAMRPLSGRETAFYQFVSVHFPYKYFYNYGNNSKLLKYFAT